MRAKRFHFTRDRERFIVVGIDVDGLVFDRPRILVRKLNATTWLQPGGRSQQSTGWKYPQ